MFVLIWMNFLRHDEHFDNVFYSYSVALSPAHAAPHAGGQHQSYVPFRIVSVGRYVPLYHNTVSKPKANTLNVCCDALLRNRQLVMILKAYITVITTYIHVLVLHIFALIYIASHLSSVMLEPLL